MSEFKLLIGGELVDGDQTMDVVNPATGKAFAVAPRASAAQVDAAVAAAKAAFPAWSALPIEARQEALRRFADKITENTDELARLLTQEHGRPLAPGKGEAGGAAYLLRHAASYDLEPEVLDDSENRRVELHHRPLGVVAAILPWNAPLWLFAVKLGPALLTGNTIVIKPAPTTSLTALLMARWCAEIFPAGVVNVITDANDLGKHLAEHPDVRKVTFTGSTATGKRVMAAAADSLKRITLELGGNDAAIVLDDADPKVVAPKIFEAAFRNSGQICLAIKRVYVHDSLYDAMCAELARLAEAAVVGDGLQQGTQYGPVQNRAQFERVRDLIEDARREGKILTGGVVEGQDGYFIRPTVVADLPESARLVQEEQFGPVLPVLSFTDEADAVRRANGTSFGLGGSVWSGDVRRASALATQLDAGTVWVNQHLASDPSFPFAGAKESGIGVELGREGILAFTQSHLINIAK